MAQTLDISNYEFCYLEQVKLKGVSGLPGW